MNSENLELKQRADSGDPLAVFEYAKHLDTIDVKKANQYYKRLAEFTPEEVHFVGYATLLGLVGIIHFNEKNYREAIEWYDKSMNYIEAAYDVEFGRELIEHLSLEASYAKAVLAAHKQENRLESN